MKSVIKIFLIPLFILVSFCALWGVSEKELSPAGDTRSHTVLVSINPYKDIIRRIAGETVQVIVLVPPGANMHTFEPTPKQMMNVSQADLWFRMGESFEEKALSSLKSYHDTLQIIDLRDGVELMCSTPQSTCPHCREGCDLHFWLDPILMKQQAKKIAQALTKAYPENAEIYRQNLQKLDNDLDQLDDEIQAVLKPMKNRAIFVSHPAFSYFAKRYNLVQYAIEFEGRDPTPQQLTKILETARENNVKTIFIQKQFNNKGARLVAQQFGARLVMLDPYADDYILEMRKTATEFSRK